MALGGCVNWCDRRGYWALVLGAFSWFAFAVGGVLPPDDCEGMGRARGQGTLRSLAWTAARVPIPPLS